MKTTLFSGLKTRVQVLALAALCAFSVTGTAFAAQDPAAPASADAPVVEAVVEEAAEVAVTPEEVVVVEAEVVEEAETSFDHGDVAWMLTATLLVLLMTVPGLALFYGGLVRSKNVLSVLSQVLVVFSLIVVLWAVYGYSAVFTGSNAFFGNFAEKAFLKGITPTTIDGGLPELLFVAFQSTFAGITTALIVGSFAERIKFGAVILFSVLWFTFSYIPMAHIVWGGGYLGELGAIDFAGGTVVHINAGVAGLVGAYFLGKRKGYGQVALKPHNVPYTFIGATLLWVGWFGFNAGSAAAADETAALAFINTILATSAAVVAWTLVETLSKGKPSALGSASGAVAGLVGITPACGTVGPLGAIVIGLAAGAICVWGVNGLKRLLGADDTADVFGVHGVGGIVGAILTGVFSAPVLGGTGFADGVETMGRQVWIQIVSVGFTIVWCAVVTAIILFLVKTFVGLRVTEEQERDGLDISSHGESAYEA